MAAVKAVSMAGGTIFRLHRKLIHRESLGAAVLNHSGIKRCFTAAQRKSVAWQRLL